MGCLREAIHLPSLVEWGRKQNPKRFHCWLELSTGRRALQASWAHLSSIQKISETTLGKEEANQRFLYSMIKFDGVRKVYFFVGCNY